VAQVRLFGIDLGGVARLPALAAAAHRLLRHPQSPLLPVSAKPARARKREATLIY